MYYDLNCLGLTSRNFPGRRVSLSQEANPFFALGDQFSGVVFWRFLFAVNLPVVGGGGPPDSSLGFV
jgi:hypothetical protein